MYRNLRVAVIAPCFNEAQKIGSVAARVREIGITDSILVVDDGSSDGSAEVARTAGAEVLSLGALRGVGAALRAGFDRLRTRCDVIVVIAGNDKDEPKEIPRLLDPIADGRADFVQGSRYLPGGRYGGAMPLYRKLATRLHPLLFSMATGKRVTDSTNGFRAFRVELLEDERVRLNQTWLDQYELEPYLYYKVLEAGYRVAEVPVTKIYPPKRLGYTKMTPRDWWSILRPLLLLRLGMRQ